MRHIGAMHVADIKPGVYTTGTVLSEEAARRGYSTTSTWRGDRPKPTEEDILQELAERGRLPTYALAKGLRMRGFDAPTPKINWRLHCMLKAGRVKMAERTGRHLQWARP